MLLLKSSEILLTSQDPEIVVSLLREDHSLSGSAYTGWHGLEVRWRFGELGETCTSDSGLFLVLLPAEESDVVFRYVLLCSSRNRIRSLPMSPYSSADARVSS